MDKRKPTANIALAICGGDEYFLVDINTDELSVPAFRITDELWNINSPIYLYPADDPAGRITEYPHIANAWTLPASYVTDIMQDKPIEIEIYDKRQKISTTMYVDKVSDNVFRAVENEMFNCRITLGTEFETRINKDGKHEIVRIVKKSDYITKRFFLTPQFGESEYRLLGDEIIKQGGFWQVDFGGIATVNLPMKSELDLEKIFKDFNFNPTFIVDEV